METVNFIKEQITLFYWIVGVLGFIILIFILKPGKKLILVPELIPYLMHYKNVRAVLSQEEWQSIAKIKYKESNYRCDICKIKGRLECHEIWSFNDKKLIQSLVGLTSLCQNCHRVKHIGLARKMGWYGDTLYHMAKVNGISKSRARKYIDYAETEVKNRKSEYNLDLTYLNKYSSLLKRRFSSYENNNCKKINGNF